MSVNWTFQKQAWAFTNKRLTQEEDWVARFHRARALAEKVIQRSQRDNKFASSDSKKAKGSSSSQPVKPLRANQEIPPYMIKNEPKLYKRAKERKDVMLDLERLISQITFVEEEEKAGKREKALDANAKLQRESIRFESISLLIELYVGQEEPRACLALFKMVFTMVQEALAEEARQRAAAGKAADNIYPASVESVDGSAQLSGLRQDMVDSTTGSPDFLVQASKSARQCGDLLAAKWFLSFGRKEGSAVLGEEARWLPNFATHVGIEREAEHVRRLQAAMTTGGQLASLVRQDYLTSIRDADTAAQSTKHTLRVQELTLSAFLEALTVERGVELLGHSRVEVKLEGEGALRGLEQFLGDQDAAHHGRAKNVNAPSVARPFFQKAVSLYNLHTELLYGDVPGGKLYSVGRIPLLLQRTELSAAESALLDRLLKIGRRAGDLNNPPTWSELVTEVLSEMLSAPSAVRPLAASDPGECLAELIHHWFLDLASSAGSGRIAGEERDIWSMRGRILSEWGKRLGEKEEQAWLESKLRKELDGGGGKRAAELLLGAGLLDDGEGGFAMVDEERSEEDARSSSPPSKKRRLSEYAGAPVGGADVVGRALVGAAFPARISREFVSSELASGASLADVMAAARENLRAQQLESEAPPTNGAALQVDTRRSSLGEQRLQKLLGGSRGKEQPSKGGTTHGLRPVTASSPKRKRAASAVAPVAKSPPPRPSFAEQQSSDPAENKQNDFSEHDEFEYNNNMRKRAFVAAHGLPAAEILAEQGWFDDCFGVLAILFSAELSLFPEAFRAAMLTFLEVYFTEACTRKTLSLTVDAVARTRELAIEWDEHFLEESTLPSLWCRVMWVLQRFCSFGERPEIFEFPEDPQDMLYQPDDATAFADNPFLTTRAGMRCRALATTSEGVVATENLPDGSGVALRSPLLPSPSPDEGDFHDRRESSYDDDAEDGFVAGSPLRGSEESENIPASVEEWDRHMKALQSFALRQYRSSSITGGGLFGSGGFGGGVTKSNSPDIDPCHPPQYQQAVKAISFVKKEITQKQWRLLLKAGGTGADQVGVETKCGLCLMLIVATALSVGRKRPFLLPMASQCLEILAVSCVELDQSGALLFCGRGCAEGEDEDAKESEKRESAKRAKMRSNPLLNGGGEAAFSSVAPAAKESPAHAVGVDQGRGDPLPAEKYINNADMLFRFLEECYLTHLKLCKMFRLGRADLLKIEREKAANRAAAAAAPRGGRAGTKADSML